MEKIEGQETEAQETPKEEIKPTPKAETAKSKSIMLIASGHPYNGRVAFNLAVSLKNNEPDATIVLIHDDTSIAHIAKIGGLENILKMVPAKGNETGTMDIFQIADNKTPYGLVSIDNIDQYERYAKWHFNKAGFKFPFLPSKKSQWKRS